MRYIGPNIIKENLKGSVIMACTTVDLREKDVINSYDGVRLGRACELELDVDCGRICALIVTPECLSSLFSTRNNIRVPWDKIIKIGCDIILVDMPQIPSGRCECRTDKCNKNDKKWWHFRKEC